MRHGVAGLVHFDGTLQFCIAHLIRSIKYLTELPDAETKAYGQTLLDAVKGMFHIIHDKDSLSAEAFEQAMEQARLTIMKAALDNVPSSLDDKGKEQKNEAFIMAKRFRDNGKAYFEFILTAVCAHFRNEPAPSLLPALS